MSVVPYPTASVGGIRMELVETEEYLEDQDGVHGFRKSSCHFPMVEMAQERSISPQLGLFMGSLNLPLIIFRSQPLAVWLSRGKGALEALGVPCESSPVLPYKPVGEHQKLRR